MSQLTKANIPAIIAVLFAILLAPLTALAEDVIKLKNGDEYRGTIVREVEGMYWIEVSYGAIKTIETVTDEEITEVIRDAKSIPADRDLSEAWTAPDIDVLPERRAGVPRAAVLSLEGTVGIQFAVEPIRRAIPMLEEMGVEILVLRINSGGGLLLEMLKLSDFVHEELKPKFRTVAWIRSAISAAAMTAHNCEEIYFYPEGNYGAATGWSGALEAMQGEGLMETREFMEMVSSRGGHDPRIMWSMQWDSGLSANVDPMTGEISFYEGDEGDHIICPVGQVLAWTSARAERWGLSKGTAKNLDELATAMNLSEVEWVGEWRTGFPYPISEAEDMMLEYRERVTRDEASFNRYLAIYNMAIGRAQGSQNDQTRAAFVGKARGELRKLYSMGLNNPNFILLNFNMTSDEFKWWFRDQNDMLDEIAAG
jgi:membrane-bound ClpP family serine protease